MDDPARRSDAQASVHRFQEARARRRRARLLTVASSAVVLAGLAVGVALLMACGQGSEAPEPPAPTTAGSSQDPGGPGQSSTTTSVEPHQSSTTDASPSTTRPRATTTSSSARPPSTSVPTTEPAPVTTSVPPSPGPTSPVPGHRDTVVIDPGHQGKGDSRPEPVGPGSSQTKPRVSSGTRGVATGIPESELVLAVSLKLRDALVAAGVDVVMTRTTQDVDLSNIQRAQIANQAGADLFVRIHADGHDDPATAGIHVLYPAVIGGWTDDIAAVSKKAAALAQHELIAATGAKDRGIDARSDMTGFNWSDVPVILPEIGFMTNAAEDRLLATPAYQDAIVGALARAIVQFLQTP